VSLVYNRGASMRGMTRTEMRVIRDECLPNRDHICIAHNIRSMCRLWEGTPVGPGLCRRRHAEADLAEFPRG
jgi:GH24 family phage-related lysozyme (muramidase)